MGTVIRLGRLQGRYGAKYHSKAILFDAMYPDPQARVHVPAGSAERDGSATFKPEVRKNNPYARPG